MDEFNESRPTENQDQAMQTIEQRYQLLSYISAINEAPPDNRIALAVVSLICGIASIVLFCAYIGFLAGFAGIVTRIISLKKRQRGRAMAGAGITCSVASIGTAIIFLWCVLAYRDTLRNAI